MTFAPIQNRLGVQPVGTTVTCVNKSGTSVAIGDLVITSFIHAGAVVDPQQAANTGYVFNCIRKAVSTETGNTGYLGVVTGLMAGAGGNGREVEVQFGGICSVKVLVTATVTPGTLLGVSSTAGVLTNSSSVMSPGGYSVTLMDNAAVADGTALKRVYIPVEYTFDSGGNSFSGPQVYGNNRAGRFLKDLIAGTNSLDVIIFGDSNTGSALAGGYGYLAGMGEALSNLNAVCYGTPVSPFVDRSPSGASRFYGVWRGTISTIAKDANFKSGLSATVGSSTNAAALPYAPWNAGTVLTSYGASTIQGTLSGVTITGTAGQFGCTAAFLQVNQQVVISGTLGGTGTITGYTNPKTYYIIATNGSTTFTLSESYSGAAIVTTAGTPTGLTYQSQADFNDWLYFDPTGTAPVSGFYKGTGINVAETHPLATNGVSQKLRVRYGTVNGSTGAFYPNVYSGGSANSLARILIDSAVSLAGTTTPTFTVYESTAFTANGKGHTANAIGYNTSGSLFSAGPGAFFCQSLYRPSTKGWAVHAHAYQSGDDSTRIAQLVTDTSTTWIQYQLQEIRERQIAASGTGRVMLFVHSGINGADTGATFTAAHIALWNKYKAVWSSLGYPETDLAIVSIVGVQKDSADTSGSGSTGNLIAVRAAANQMALANPDMTVVDVKALMPYAAMTYGTGSASYYQRLNNSPNQGSDIVVHLSGGLVEGVGGWVITGVAISGTAGQFTCSAAPYTLIVGMSITIVGTLGGTGTITGYVNGTKYYITATNGSTTFTLSTTYGGAGVVTTAGTPTGLTYNATNVATVTTSTTMTLTGNLAVPADGWWVNSTINVDLVGGSTAAPAYQEAYVTQYNGTTKVATVRQWTGGQPTNGTASEIRMSRRYPSDGYTVVSQAILSSLIK